METFLALHKFHKLWCLVAFDIDWKCKDENQNSKDALGKCGDVPEFTNIVVVIVV